MKKSEFYNYMKEHNINLATNNIVVGETTNTPFSIGCFFENGKWNLYKVGERQNFRVIATGSEDDIFEQLCMEAISRNKNGF